jgi:hypothetical protein
MNPRIRFLPLLCAAALLWGGQIFFPGCATIVNGPTEKLEVKAKPVGASVYLNGKLLGPAPVTATLNRWGEYRVRIEMAGYQPVEVSLQKSFNTNAGWNLYMGGVWIVVDAVTGAIFRFDVPPENRGEVVQLAQFSWERTLSISTTLKPEPGARRIGQMKRL